MAKSNRGLSVSEQKILILPKSASSLRRMLFLTEESLKGQRETKGQLWSHTYVMLAPCTGSTFVK